MKASDFYFETAVALAPLRLTPSDRSEMVSQMLAGEQCRLIQTGEKDWVEVELISDSYRGWCDRKQLITVPSHPSNSSEFHSLLTQSPFSFWLDKTGRQYVIPAGSRLFCNPSGQWRLGNEVIEPLTDLDTCFSPCVSPLQAALNFLGAPYLWGGKSALGIDCSGLIQLAFALNNVALPRDASLQVACGSAVNWMQRTQGDLAFFSNTKGEVIHVGVLEREDVVLHAAGEVRLDELTAKGIRKSGNYTHELHSLRRINY